MPTTYADYIGRTVDVAAFDGAKPTGKALLAQVLARPGQGGKIVTGIQKLVQRFLIELFTEAGTVPYHPDRGTMFLTEIRSGELRTHLDVLGAFARAVSTIQRTFAAEDKATDPPDERLESVTLDSISFEPGTLRLYATLTSRAGASRPLILPIALVL